MNILIFFCPALVASREWVPPVSELLVPVTVQQAGLEPAESKPHSLSSEALENVIDSRCSHPLCVLVYCKSMCRTW